MAGTSLRQSAVQQLHGVYAKRSGVAAWEASSARDDAEHIYALFRTRSDQSYGTQQWDPEQVMRCIEAFETDARNKLVENVGRTSPYPRILPLRDLLKAKV